MRTLVIQIDEPSEDGGDYPITFLVDGESVSASGGGAGSVDLNPTICVPEESRTRIAEVLGDHQRPLSELREIGRYLCDLLKDNPVGKSWFALCDGEDEGTLTYLDIRPIELQRLPWEFMIDDRPDPVFLNRKHRLMRGRPGRPAAAPPLPLRVLAVVCDLADEYLAEDEIDAIYAGLRGQPGIWQVEVLREPTWEALRDTMKVFPPRIIHFIGETDDSDPPAFKIRSHDGHTEHPYRKLSAEQIRRLLRISDSFPSLFVLNACGTIGMAPSEFFRGIGAQGVLAMQTDVYSPPAVLLTRVLYEELARTGSLEEAVWHVRAALSGENANDYYDWGRPVLTIYGPPEGVIHPDLPNLAKRANQLAKARYPLVGLLADRIDKHRKVWGTRPDLPPAKHLILVSGTAKAGKSQLVRSCMLTWELCGSRGILVDMAEPDAELPDRSNLNVREALLRICHVLLEEFADESASAGGGSVRDSLLNLEESLREASQLVPRRESEPYAEACEQLRHILARIVARQPLVLALDHMEYVIDRNISGPIIATKLLLPLAQGSIDDLYTIVVLRKDDSQGLALLPDDDKWTECVEDVRVDLFQPNDVISVGREYGARRGRVAARDWHETLRKDRRLHDGAWTPALLRKIFENYEEGNPGGGTQS